MIKLLKSFYYAFRGIFTAILSERNMRIHIVVMAYMYFFLFCFDFFTITKTELAIIFLANALVIGGELINTAIESAVDLYSKEYSEKAKIAKDCAAGAVLVFAIFSVLVGVVIMWQPLAFQLLFEFFSDTPLAIGYFVLSLIIFIAFIFYDFNKETE